MTKSILPIWKIKSRWSAVEARAALADLETSGLSVAAFAKREGLVPERLYSWRRLLVETDDAIEAEVTEFVEVHPRSRDKTIEVAFPSGVVLRVAEAIEPATFGRLVAALERKC